MKKDDRKRSDSLTSILGGDASFDGTLTLNGSLRIDGSFQGSLTCGGSVTIGEQGSFNGDIEAEDLILGGKIRGCAIVKKLVVLEAPSVFEGDLTCATLHVNEGAVFNGTSSMGEHAVEQKLNESKLIEGDLHRSDQVAQNDPSDDVKDAANGFHFSGTDEESEQEIRDRRT
jgi:cytoskeletal protein CcmA (bactofilin family)